MELLISYATREEIPEGMADLYTEREGKYVFSAIKGIKMQEDLDKLQGALNNEREAHKSTRAELQGKLTNATNELEDLKKKNPEPDPIDPKNLPPSKDPNVLALEATVKKQGEALEAMQKEKEGLEADKQKSSILEALRKQATGKVRDEAIADLELYQGNFTVTDAGEVVVKESGQSVADWFSETLKSKPHWEKPNVSGGAKGADPGSPGTGLSAKKKRLDEILKKDSIDLREQTEASELAEQIKAEEEASNTE